jgi:hypothetical protein
MRMASGGGSDKQGLGSSMGVQIIGPLNLVLFLVQSCLLRPRRHQSLCFLQGAIRDEHHRTAKYHLSRYGGAKL